MTEAIVEIVKVGKINNVEGSDNLNFTNVGDYQVVMRKDNGIKEGDLALFISVNSVIPEEILNHYGLKDVIKNGRVRTVKLRGFYSQGLLLDLTHPYFKNNPDKIFEGSKVGGELNIHKYVSPVKVSSGNVKMRPWVSNLYKVYDIESLQTPEYYNSFNEDDDVNVTEKIHGMHFSCGYKGDEFFYTKRKASLKIPEDGSMNVWYEPVVKYGLVSKLKELKHELGVQDIALRGEIYGWGVQKLHYGLDQNTRDVVIYDIEAPFNKYLPNRKMVECCRKIGIPVAPVLYEGKFDRKMIRDLAERDSALARDNNKNEVQMSEGVVVKSLNEDKKINNERVILKFISKRYDAKHGSEEVSDE